uniref:Acyltransferase 3 domain-containing protein n=1 Tax=Bombyx mori TaxID=7091 RepID=A0A8R2R5S0_BOMMO|nr:O-acyltransferase like protein isoform X3 [Bombyx mori]
MRRRVDEQYYEMPTLFHLDEYERCLATRGVYCTGSFELSPQGPHQLFQLMQRYAANWVDNFNHTRLHRGLCVSQRCRQLAPQQHPGQGEHNAALAEWFESCVNESTMLSYNLSSRLYQLEYCRRGEVNPDGLSTNERAFAGFVAILLALCAVSTVLDLTLSDHAKKGAAWALSFSIPGCWRSLLAPPPCSSETDLRAFDGLRVLCMMCVIIEHVCWITTHTFLADTRRYEQTRRALDAMLMANSTLVVQIFFMMSSFLLAHKLLQQRRRGEQVPVVRTFFDTMINRIIRVSPSYFVVVWFAASWWSRAGSGPMWTPLIEAEVNICRSKWWTHLLYLNNIVYANDKCLIQTWYLAADMQLYGLSLLLTLALWRCRRGAIYVLTALLAGSIALLFGLAYTWRLVPTFVMHRPESVRTTYSTEPSFNVLYQSPLGNVPGALAGLLLAHLHHQLLDSRIVLSKYKWFRWSAVSSVCVSAWWVAASPLLLGRGAPGRGGAAALAALERPIFAFFVGVALLGAMHGVPSPIGSFLSWRGWGCGARLSFGALLLHLPLNKSLVAARLAPTQLDRQSAVVLSGVYGYTAIARSPLPRSFSSREHHGYLLVAAAIRRVQILEWFGVASVSYLAALPLALCVELPAQRLHRALSALRRRSHAQSDAAPHDTRQKTDL